MEVAEAHHKLAAVYQRKNDIDKAQEHFEQAWQMHKECLGEENAATKRSLIGCCDTQGRKYYQEEDYKKAAECYQKLLKLKIEVYGSEQHAEVAYCYNNPLGYEAVVKLIMK